MKNIAIIYERELSIGGVETHLLSLLKHVNPARFNYTIISPIDQNFSQIASALGARILPIPNFKPLDLIMVRQLTKKLYQGQIDLVHIHSPVAAIPARLAARRLGLPTIVTVHIPAIYYYGVRSTLRARAGRSIYSAIDRLLNYTMTTRLVYVSSQVYHYYIDNQLSPENRSLVIPNGIDLTQFQPDHRRERLRNQYHLSPETLLITYVGRFSDQKGLDVLLKGLALLKSACDIPFNVWLIGSGPIEEELRILTAELELQEKVHFLGTRQSVADYLFASDCFVLPSNWEAMSIALLEAMAAGLPCVVTNVGDNANLVEDGTHGFIIPTNSPAHLAEALQRLLEDKALREKMGANAFQKARAFSEIKMAEKIEVLYEQILQIEPIPSATSIG